MNIAFQILLDTCLLFVCGEVIFRKNTGIIFGKLKLIPIIFIFFVVSRANIVMGESNLPFFEEFGFEIFPVNSIYMLLFFILFLTIFNSVIYKENTTKSIFCGSVAEISLYLLFRMCGLLLFNICGSSGDTLIFGSRVASIAFVVLLLLSPVRNSLQKMNGNSGIFAWIISSDFLIIWAYILTQKSFDYYAVFANRWQVLLVMMTIFFLDLVLFYINLRITEEKNHIRTIEQYVPIVEELVLQVRSKQHEFNNQMIAIDAAVTTAETLEEAKAAVLSITGGATINCTDYDLLCCDSKIITGLLYEKTMCGRQWGISILAKLESNFKRTTTLEMEWLEILGIFIDNALEATKSGDIIYVNSVQRGNLVELTVKNPALPLSNTEFAELFKRGKTNKTDKYNHGFGLYNVSEIVKKYNGKVIVRNITIENVNYLEFGVVLP